MKKLIILTIIFFNVQFAAPIFGQSEQKLRLVVQLWHDGDVEITAFSPDAKIIATGGYDSTVKIWNAENGLLINTLTSHKKPIYALGFSSDGRYLASGSADNSIKIWNIETGQETKSFNDFATGLQTCMGVAFSFDGKILASINEHNQVNIWNIETGQQINSFYSSGDDRNTLKKRWLLFSQDGKNLAVKSEDSTIRLWNVETGEASKSEIKFPAYLYQFQDTSSNGRIRAEIDNEKIILKSLYFPNESKTLEGYGSPLAFANLSSLRKILVTASNDKNVRFWSIESGKQFASTVGHNRAAKSIIFSDDGKIMASGGDNDTVKLWEVDTGKEIKTFKGFRPLRISNDGKTLSSTDCCYKIQLWDLNAELQTKSLEFRASMITSLSLSPDGKVLALGTMGPWINLLNAKTGEHIKFFDIRGEPTESVAFSKAGKILAAGLSDSTIKLWDLETGKVLQNLKHGLFFGNPVNVVKFSSNGKFLVSGSRDKTIKIWEVETGKELNTLEGHESDVTSITLLPNENFIFSSSRDGTVKLWDINKKNSLATLISLNKYEWVVTTASGRFDTNKVENPQGLHWIMPDAPFKPLSFEVFMRDYYEPNLLPRLLKCTENGNCDEDKSSLPREFKPVRNLTELNRTQPNIKIIKIKPTDLPDVVKVSIEAEDTASEYQKDRQNQPLHSGVFDLRLFRDGQLVGYSTADEKLQTTFKTYQNFDEELKTWQAANKVELVNGKKTFTFNVKLPKNSNTPKYSNAQEFNFTAYAFNSDRVKSETASQTFKPEKPLPTAKGNAYIITIGVNANENSSYNLRYAANDARRLQDELGKRMPAGKYEKIVQIPLISDYDKDGKVTENNATKEKIKAVLDKLAGKTVANESLKDVPNREMLKKVEPEDLVLIAFSGHGYADKNGIFYLVPSNIGKTAENGLSSILPKAISSDELSLWLRDVDAGEMMMIVDACHSAAAVQGKDFKTGPMGSRGLGQLSYDKGMRILTATQADNVALELGSLQQGLLTYSLVKNGLELGQADYQPIDNKLFSNEWLSFAVKDVPDLYKKIEKGEIKDLLINGEKTKGVEVINLDNTNSNLNLQQPSLFDFGRRDRQYELFSIQK